MSKQESTAQKSPPRVVLGTGPDALRAAAVLAYRGHAVHLLQTGETASGLRHPDLPVGLGRLRVDDAHRHQVESVLGPLVEAPEAHQGVVMGGKVRKLPLSKVEAGQLLPPAEAAVAGRSWARTRFRNVLAEVVGGGQEERTYKDWVVRRFGEPAWFHIHRPYAERRWGASSEALSVSVARVYHGLERRGAEQVVGGGSGEALARAEALVEAAGGTISTSVKVQGITLTDGKVSSVETAEGTVPVIGGLLTTASPDLVVGWLGEQVPQGLRVDASKLRLLTRVQVMLRGNVDGLPQALHVLDEDSPFWRVVTPYGLEQAAIFHATYPYPDSVPSEAELVSSFRDAAERLGVGSFSTEGARVEIIPDWQPLWLEGTHARLRRLLLAWRSMGVLGVGRGGAFAALDSGEEVLLADYVAGSDSPDLWEYHRLNISPPSTLPDLHAHITRFVER